MKRLLLDLGNTRLKWALHDGAGMGPMHAVLPADDPSYAALRPALAEAGEVLLCSTAPGREPPLLARLQARGLDALRPAVRARFGGLAIAYRQPARLGIDRWLAMLGAMGGDAGADAALLVAGCGTALTLDRVDPGGRHAGGLIAPGPALMAESLVQRAPHLPEPDRAASPWVLADDTAAAMAGGCLGACAALIDRIAAAAPGAGLVLHGGAAGALSGWLATPHRVAPGLVLEGLLRWRLADPDAAVVD